MYLTRANCWLLLEQMVKMMLGEKMIQSSKDASLSKEKADLNYEITLLKERIFHTYSISPIYAHKQRKVEIVLKND